jgi:hypothetical protein
MVSRGVPELTRQAFCISPIPPPDTTTIQPNLWTTPTQLSRCIRPANTTRSASFRGSFRRNPGSAVGAASLCIRQLNQQIRRSSMPLQVTISSMGALKVRIPFAGAESRGTNLGWVQTIEGQPDPSQATPVRSLSRVQENCTLGLKGVS